MNRLLLAPLLALTLLPSCAPPDTRAADEAAVHAQDEKWLAAINRHDLDATVSFYAPDAVILPPAGPMLDTPQSIRDSWASALASDLTMSVQTTKTEVSGNTAWVYGSYTLTIKNAQGGPNLEFTGRFVDVWRKQPDGAWKCAIDMSNSAPPVPAAEQQ